MQRFTLFLFALAVCWPSARGLPTYFHERNIGRTCTEHPSKAAGGHLPPVTDNNIVVAARQQEGPPLKEVCPGESYALSVSFGGEERAALVTVSGGTLKEANVAGCSNAIVTGGKESVKELIAQWEVPCSLLGRVEVKVTTATNGTSAWLKNSGGFVILPVSKCPGYNKCKTTSDKQGTPGSATPAALAGAAGTAGTNSSSSAAAAAPTAAASAKDNAAAAGGSVQLPVAPLLGLAAQKGAPGQPRSGRMCMPSGLGYQCSVVVAEGVAVHFSHGGQPPENVCTNNTATDKAAKDSSSLMHFAIETQQQGYVGLGFPLAPGRMVPADAVIARLDNATNTVKVQPYRLAGKFAEGIRPVLDWTMAPGAVRRQGGSSSGGGSNGGGSGGSSEMIMCFSRQAVTRTSLVPNLDASMVPIIWASSNQSSWGGRHDKDGSLIINMLSGQHAVLNKHDATAAAAKSRFTMHIAHGAAMIAAFCLLMPAAGLIARHRWLLTPSDKPYNPTSGGAWLVSHWSLQLLGSAVAFGAYLAAMVLWYRKHGLGADRHALHAPHCELGTGVIAMVAVQVLAGAVRRCVPDRHKPTWRAMHGVWGWATVIAGGANCILGSFLMHDLLGQPLLPWLLSAVCVLGGLLVAGMVLEVPRMKRVKEVCCWDEDTFSTAAPTSEANKPQETQPAGAGAAADTLHSTAQHSAAEAGAGQPAVPPATS